MIFYDKKQLLQSFSGGFSNPGFQLITSSPDAQLSAQRVNDLSSFCHGDLGIRSAWDIRHGGSGGLTRRMGYMEWLWNGYGELLIELTPQDAFKLDET